MCALCSHAHITYCPPAMLQMGCPATSRMVLSGNVADGWSGDVADGLSDDIADGWSGDVADGLSSNVADGVSPFVDMEYE